MVANCEDIDLVALFHICSVWAMVCKLITNYQFKLLFFGNGSLYTPLDYPYTPLGYSYNPLGYSYIPPQAKLKELIIQAATTIKLSRRPLDWCPFRLSISHTHLLSCFIFTITSPPFLLHPHHFYIIFISLHHLYIISISFWNST